MAKGWSAEDAAHLEQSCQPRDTPAFLLRDIRKPILAGRLVLLTLGLERARRIIAQLGNGTTLADFYVVEVPEAHEVPGGMRYHIQRRHVARAFREMPPEARWLVLGADATNALGCPFLPYVIQRKLANVNALVTVPAWPETSSAVRVILKVA